MKTNENTETLPQKILCEKTDPRIEKIKPILENNCRATLTHIANQTGIPISTVFDTVEKIREKNTLKLVLEPTGNKIYGSDKQEAKLKKIIGCLKEDPTMKLTEMKLRIQLPVSSIFDLLNKLKQAYNLKMKIEPR